MSLPRAIIRFVFAPDCAACQSMEPILLKFQVSRGYNPPVIKSIRDVTSRSGEVFSPKLTPGFAVELDGSFVATHEGAFTLPQLERWFDGAVRG